MVRLLVVAAVAGAGLAIAAAWSFRSEVALAKPTEPTPMEDWVSLSVHACLDSYGVAEITSQGGVARVACRPSLGVKAVKR